MDGSGSPTLPNLAANFQPFLQAQETDPAGPDSSPLTPISRPRLNPNFVDHLMGWPPGWTQAGTESIGFGAVEMESWLSRQRALLRSFFGGSNRESDAA